MEDIFFSDFFPLVAGHVVFGKRPCFVSYVSKTTRRCSKAHDALIL